MKLIKNLEMKVIKSTEKLYKFLPIRTLLLGMTMFSTTAVLAGGIEPNGKLLPEGSYCYTAKATANGSEQLVALVKQQVIRNGKMLEVLVHQQVVSRNIEMIDRFSLRIEDMTPKAFSHSMTGGNTVTLTYHTQNGMGKITGVREGKNEGPMDVEFSNKIWEGNLWGTLFASLQLEELQPYSIPMYQYDKGLFSMELPSVRKSRINFNGLDTPVFEVDVNVNGRIVTYYIRQSDRLELGYKMPGFTQWLGGDCSGLKS